jgi:hypothetical protein
MHGAHLGINYLQQTYQTQTTAASARASQAQATAFAAAADSVEDAEDAGNTPSPAPASKSRGGSSSGGASGVKGGLLASSTLASLLGLQEVDGQTEADDGGVELKLPELAQPNDITPGASLSEDAEQALQSASA